MAAEQKPSDTDSHFYLPADTFFLRHADIGLTYDDVTLATLYSGILPRDRAGHLPCRRPQFASTHCLRRHGYRH